MGIKGLTQLIGDCAPGAIKENEIKNYFGIFNCVEFEIVLFTHEHCIFQVEKLLLMLQ